MSEQTRQLAERIARDLFTGYHVNGWTEAGLMIRIEKHLRHAADASVPQEAAIKGINSFVAELHEMQYAPAGIKTVLLAFAAHVRRLTGEASSAPQGEQVTEHKDQATRADRRGLSERFGTAGADLDYSREQLIADYLREYDLCVEGLTSITPREYFAGVLEIETRR